MKTKKIIREYGIEPGPKGAVLWVRDGKVYKTFNGAKIEQDGKLIKILNRSLGIEKVLYVTDGLPQLLEFKPVEIADVGEIQVAECCDGQVCRWKGLYEECVLVQNLDPEKNVCFRDGDCYFFMVAYWRDGEDSVFYISLNEDFTYVNPQEDEEVILEDEDEAKVEETEPEPLEAKQSLWSRFKSLFCA